LILFEIKFQTTLGEKSAQEEMLWSSLLVSGSTHGYCLCPPF